MAAKKKRVLIVEDALDVARLISSALETVDPNLKIMICPSAEEAMLESAREGVQLLITDIRLPGISGPELVRKIGARNPSMKVILITGLTGAQIGKQMDGIQADGFFRKPFELSALVDVAQRCLGIEEARPAQDETPAPKPSDPGGALEQRLQALRQNLNATAALLVGPRGKIAAASGEFPGAFDGEWAGPVLEAFAGQKRLAGLMNAGTPRSALTVSGKSFDLVLAPVLDYALTLALRPQSSPLRLALALEEALLAQPELQALLKDLPAPAPVESPAKAAEAAMEPASPAGAAEPVPQDAAAARGEPETALPADEPAFTQNPAAASDFAALFDNSGSGLPTVDVDAFWEALAESTAIEPVGKDSISFEKARKMGLVSDSAD